MKRRALLHAATLAAAGSAAGCLAGGSGSADRTTTTQTTTTQTTTTEEPDEPFETLTIGSREGVLDPENNKPHSVLVVNAASEARTIRVRVQRSGENPLLKSRSWEFPADGRLLVKLQRPADYRVVVFLGDDRVGEFDVERSWFDCNSSRTTATVTADGDVETETISTTMGCGSSVRNHSLAVTDRRCRSDNESETASVAFGDGALDLSGVLVVPSPDYGAAVERVEWDRLDGGLSLTVTVVATEPDEDAGGGVQCVGALDYEVTLEVDGELPGEVTVQHRSRDETRTVATVSATE